LCNTNNFRTEALNEAFIAIKTAEEALLGNPFSLQDILVQDAAVTDHVTLSGIDTLRHELGPLKAQHLSDRTAMIAKQEKKQIADGYESQIQALQDLCSKDSKCISHVTIVVNQNYENLQAKNVLYEDLERSHSALENEYCGLESEHVELCLELARWKANYRELAIVISDLEEID